MLSSILKRSKIKSQNNIDPSAEQTRNMNIEIMALSSQTAIKEAYISDIENSISLNRQAALILVEFNGEAADFIERFRQLTAENQRLLEQIIECREKKENTLAEILIQEQIHTQQSQFYRQRLADIDIRIDDLRKTMQDKEYNYYVVAERLSVYEEIEQRPVGCSSYEHQMVFEEAVQQLVMAKLSADKYSLADQIKNTRQQAKSLKKLDEAMKEAIRQGKTLRDLRKFESKTEVASHGDIRHSPQQEEELHDIKIPQEKSEQTTLVQELLKTYKKEKNSQHVLRMSLRDSVNLEAELRKRYIRYMEGRQTLKEKLEQAADRIRTLRMCLQRYGNRRAKQLPVLKPIKMSHKQERVPLERTAIVDSTQLRIRSSSM